MRRPEAGSLRDRITTSTRCAVVSLKASSFLISEKAMPGRAGWSSRSNSRSFAAPHPMPSANAWRHIVRFSNPANAAASLVLAGWQVAQDRQRGGVSGLQKDADTRAAEREMADGFRAEHDDLQIPLERLAQGGGVEVDGAPLPAGVRPLASQLEIRPR